MRRIVYSGLVGLTLGVLASSACAQERPALPRPGQPAPPLVLEHLLNAPPGAQATWEALRGKAVVLEFWATWCAPCVAAIPHMNELTDAFKDKPVVFISITDEPLAKITKFLKDKRQIHGWVGLDTDRSVLLGYGLTAIPQTILVDARGRVAAVTSPTQVTRQTIEDLLAGKLVASDAPSAPVAITVAPAPPGPDGAEALFQLRIAPASGAGMGSTTGRGRITLKSYTARDLVEYAHGVPSYRVDWRADGPRDRFDATISAPSASHGALLELLRGACAATFGLRTRIEKRTVDACVLRVAEGGAKLPATAMDAGGGSSSNASPTSFSFINHGAGTIAEQFGYRLSAPVFDETGLTARYDVTFNWPAEDTVEALSAAARDQLGLELRAEKREVAFLVVERSAE
ncbi:MAG: TIGR03435 family protein [Phycisphaerae bacterium]|nr:TIGR03435 family protein [Phycisphaerae bacterium]MCZ2398259.1 TIGR03435 family protein [Phycisphaerae bacterium]NUQ50653.1 TIGR03435 family protein [Phycisphaerae bacterium]